MASLEKIASVFKGENLAGLPAGPTRREFVPRRCKFQKSLLLLSICVYGQSSAKFLRKKLTDTIATSYWYSQLTPIVFFLFFFPRWEDLRCAPT